jgi:peptidoglycan pentaglycine glycine transferase (the first glycine)
MITLKEVLNKQEYGLGSGLSSIPLTQTFFYGEIQKRVDRSLKRFQILEDGTDIGFVQFVVYPLLGHKVYWYASYGPVITKSDTVTLEAIKLEVQKIVSNTNVVFVRFDFTPTLQPSDISQIFILSPESSSIGAYFQPRTEWYTDISPDPETILADMHSKTRYSVRYAEKRGVNVDTVYSNLLDHLPTFLKLMKTTSDRNKFSLHGDDYYKYYFEEVGRMGNGFLAIASLGEEVLAMHFVVMEGDVAHYVLGASSNTRRDLCGPYLAHFRAMIEAKSKGMNKYNFGAVSVGGDTHWQSLTIFKQKFGGETVYHSPLADLILKPVWYYMYILRKYIKKFI